MDGVHLRSTSRFVEKEKKRKKLFLFLLVSPFATMLLTDFEVDSPNVTRTADAIEASYDYETTRIEMPSGGGGAGGASKPVIRPTKQRFTFRTKTKVPKLG